MIPKNVIRRCFSVQFEKKVSQPEQFSIKETLSMMAGHAQVFLLFGSILGGVSLAVAKIQKLEDAIKKLEEKLESESKRIEDASDLKLIIVEKSIAQAKVEAEIRATNNYMKYSHSEEYASLRPKNEK